jgi:hypothetical protein
VKAAKELRHARRAMVLESIFAEFGDAWTEAIVRPGAPSRPPAVGVYIDQLHVVRYKPAPIDGAVEMSAEMAAFLTDERNSHFASGLTGGTLNVVVGAAKAERLKNPPDPMDRLRFVGPHLRLAAPSPASQVSGSTS